MRILRRSSLWSTVLLALVVGGAVALVGAQVRPVGALVGLAPALLILGIGLRRALRRWRTARAPMPADWRRWLQTHVPLYRRLSDEGRRRFDRDVRFVLDEYTFEGVKGVEVTDALRLSVAAGAALLLHGRPTWELPGSRSVLFYPERFNDDYYDSARGAYDGMAHQQGPIILTAPAVEASWARPADGDNVVLHELAHLFDFDSEGADGVPSLVAPATASSWQALVRREMRRVRDGQSILRPYAAEAPSEFFAVAVETFYEQPHRMADVHADLFAALVAVFQFDPRAAQRVEPSEVRDGTAEEHAASQVTGPADDTDRRR
ncbi:MAG: M90 family metallopeptidase [Salinibacter sp.]